ncbi:MAG: hypothetical protein KC549_19165, partial [Myxococcales bacterium]|nr:hypothetical protein [Myxococcales bacterium]
MLLDATPAFTDVVEQAADDYFEALLPRCIDAWLAGRGYRLIAEMLDAHDADDLDALRALPAPTPRAVALAARARVQCPLVVVGNLYVDAHGHAVLGQYAHRSIISPHFLLSFQVVSEEHLVTLFEPAFQAAIAPDRLEHEVRLTIFHEYIHYFESFLPAEEQPLRAREQGRPHRRYTPAEAARLDRRFTRRRRALFIGGPAAAIALAVAISPQLQAPRDELVMREKAAPARPRDAGPPRDIPAER